MRLKATAILYLHLEILPIHYVSLSLWIRRLLRLFLSSSMWPSVKCLILLYISKPGGNCDILCSDFALNFCVYGPIGGGGVRGTPVVGCTGSGHVTGNCFCMIWHWRKSAVHNTQILNITAQVRMQRRYYTPRASFVLRPF